MPSDRRFPPRWTVEETDACFIGRDHARQALAYVYFEDEPGRRTADHRSPTSAVISAAIQITLTSAARHQRGRWPRATPQRQQRAGRVTDWANAAGW